MHVLSRIVTTAAVLIAAAAPTASAQRRPSTGPEPLARLENQPGAPQQPAAAAGPKWSLLGGFASGDGAYDLGLALGATARWHRADWPVTVRGDGYFAHHGGNFGSPAFGSFDVSLNILGAMGSAEYAFPTTSTVKPYVFGGLGVFYSHFSVDYNGTGFNDSAYDSSMDLGLGIGGGLRLTQNFGLELQVKDIGGFTTIPIVAVLYF
jgi:hypothetical protein